MSSHLSKLREQFAAKENELKEQVKAVEELAAVTKQLESQQRALHNKSAELSDNTDTFKAMEQRVSLLTSLEAPLQAALKDKTTSHDVLQQVLESVARSSFATINDIVKSALKIALQQGANPSDLLQGVAKTAYDVLGDKAKAAEPVKEAPIVNLPKENVVPARQPQATPDSKNGLRGQADDFKPRSTTPNGNGGGGGWETFARQNGVGGFGAKKESPARQAGQTSTPGWNAIPGWGL